MAINFNTNPYYDDFDENKKFHRILFRPGYAVQARELTQLQTQLQDQIDKFGKHVFVNGSVVLGGGRIFEKDLNSLKVQTNFNSATVNPANFADKTIIGQTSGAEATVKKAIGLTGSDPITFIVKLTSGNAFQDGETIQTADGTYSASLQGTGAVNDAMMFSVDEGVFFVDGKFVFSEAQTVAVDKYSNTSSKNIGFIVNETIVDSDADESLLDRAQGSPNYAAPGADRYKVALTLTSKDINTDVDNFIETARVVDGELVINKAKTIYSEIGNELARRTFDESGDYTVKRFPIQVLDHQADTPDATKFTVALDPGKAYVKGYEFESINQEFLALDRARETDEALSVDVSTIYGNYVYVDTLGGDPTATNPITNKVPNDYSIVQLRDNSNQIGSAKLRYLKWQSSATPYNPTTTIYKAYLFDIQMNTNEVFGSVTQIGSLTWGAQINELSKVGGTGATFLSGSNDSSLVFPFPNDYIENVTNSDYLTQRTFTITFNAGVANIATTSANERFIGTGTLDQTTKRSNYIVFAPGGNILDFTSDDITVGANVNGSTQTLEIDYSATNNTLSGDGILIANVNQNNVSERSKNLSNYQVKILGDGAGGLNATIGGTDSLEVSDIYEVKAIYNVGTSAPSVTVDGTTGVVTGMSGETDVTDRYIVDDGQRGEYYDHGGITLSGTAPTTNDYLVVVYKNFTHSGNGFLSRNSYSVAYEDIPVFTDPATGEEIELRDSIDFRPRRVDGGTGFEGGLIADPDGTFNSDYTYYLGRIDKVIATANQEFVIKQGVPAVYPKVPTDLSNGMSLYAVLIPPYTADVADVQIKYIDNQRYTMKDIGKLEKRINNLEYYTQLSLLEKQAKDTSIADASNLEKFKNGFAVDPFTSADIFATAGAAWSQRRWGWWNAWFNGSNTWNFAAQNYNDNSLAQPANADFNAAIDPLNQELRAPFTTEFHGFNTGTLTNTEKTGDLVGLQHTEVVAIDQSLATTYLNINPFNIIRFAGFISLEPAFDQWVDTNQLPAVNRIVDVQLPDAADRIVNRFTGSGNRAIVTSTTTTVEQNVISSQTASLGSNVVDVQFIPYIRANTVTAIGNSFKPLSRLYGYMENTAISSYMRPLTLIEVQNHNGVLFDGTKGVYEALTFTSGGTAKTAIYSDPTTADDTKRLLTVFDDTGTIQVGDIVTGENTNTATVTAVTTYSLGDAMVPDEYGNIGVEFQIPADTFKTGERTFRLINNNTNDVEAQDSIGEAKYTASGLLQNKQETILTTRAIQNQRVITRRGRRIWVDPLAQSFLIDPDAYPEGMHISSVDVYFRSKSNTVPVTMEIRRTVNGYPEAQSTSIPFAVSVLKPEQVQTSTNGALATKFSFPSIHLTPGEYAITLLANSSDYEVYVAEMGQTLLGGTTKVDKQPYAGSLFKSQNGSTWEADQNKDLKFRIHRASFVTSGTALFEIQDPTQVKNYHALFANASAITPTGTNIKWSARAYSGVAHEDYYSININQDIEYTRLLELDAAANTVGGSAGEPSLILKAEMTTDSDVVSPLIDAASLAVVATENIINNDSTNEAGTSQGGNALAKYITKPINLADGFDASNINVTVDINRPAATNVKVYFRTLPSGSVTPITNENWVEMELETVVPSSINNFDFKEYRFFPAGAFDQYDVPQDDPITTRFNTFQVKIVMLSSQTQFSPKLRDLRIIALDS